MEIFMGNSSSEKIYVERKNIITLLYENLRPVSDFVGQDIVDNNKYVRLALNNNYSNYRLGILSNLMSLKVIDSFSAFNQQFFRESGIFLAIFNTYADKPVGVVFRSLDKKEFIDFSIFTNIYGIDCLPDDFRYGDPVVITEGIYDADVFRQVYNNTLAVYTSSVSIMQSEVLNTVTNKVILALDADDAGERGYHTSVKNLKRVNSSCDISKLIIYKGDKDLGDIEDGYDKQSKIDYYRMSLKVML